MIEELKAAVESVRKSGPTDERQHFYQAEVARAFLAKHGPALIEALRAAMEGLEPFEDDCGGSTIEDDWRHLDGLRTHAIAALARVTAILEGK